MGRARRLVHTTSTWKPAAAIAADDLACMGAITRLDREFQARTCESETRQIPSMLDIDDVALLVCNNSCDHSECPWAVGDIDMKSDKSSRSGKASQQDGRQHAGVDISTARDQRNGLATKHLGILENRGERGCARTLDNRLLDLDVQGYRLFDTLLGDCDDLIDEFPDHRGVSTPGSATAIPSAIVGPPVGEGPRPSACSIPG